MKLTCLIVDDEPLSREILEGYISNVENLELMASLPNALEALKIIQDQKVDLLFLDINMPKLSGLDFYRSLQNPPLIIFTTAYPEFAAEGFELDAVDYLVKPFSMERFLKGVNKAIDRYKSQMVEHQPLETEYIIIRADKKTYRLDLSEILYLESIGDYVKIHAEGQTLVTHERLKNLEERLRPNGFIRIHRSYLICADKIKYLEGNTVVINETRIPIGSSYKMNLSGLLPDPEA